MNTNDPICDKINRVKELLTLINRKCWGRHTRERIEQDIRLLTFKADQELVELEKLCLKSKD